MATLSPSSPTAAAEAFLRIRGLSPAIAAPLSEADASAQPMPDASPAKWHLAHTTWFFETFLLRDHVPEHRLYDESWAYLFNSYYEGEGDRHPRAERGLITRPSLAEILAWRDHVDTALLANLDRLPAGLVTLGLNHEQQHQELMLMDMLATLAASPLRPAAWPPAPAEAAALADPPPLAWIERGEGLVEVGAGAEGFAFDCERPRHLHFLHAHALASRPVTNGEWTQFIADGGYDDPRLWLADGWAWVQTEGIEAPLYWERRDGAWLRFGLDGLRRVDPAAPVCHVSYYEADAFARWAGARLPTEYEWEAAAAGHDPHSGRQLDAAVPVQPRPSEAEGMADLFGNVWEWTASAFLPYPGFRPEAGTVGEYNGKFMVSQMVLRGGCCATPRGHLRASYRNFFYPHQRWMFAGLRLAKDL